jgi:hypothetical protein
MNSDDINKNNMAYNDNNHPTQKSASPKDALLDELESIKDLLLKNQQNPDSNDATPVDLNTLNSGIPQASTKLENFDLATSNDESFDDLDDLSDDDFDADDLNIDIPILEDVVDHKIIASSSSEDKASPPILDLATIFEDPIIESELDVIESNPETLDLEELNLSELDPAIEIPKFNLSTAPTEEDQTKPVNDAEQPATVTTLDGTPTLIADDALIFDDDPIADKTSQPISHTGSQDSNARTIADEQVKKPISDKPINIDLLIQEIVDDYIPVIEDQLRQRLSQYSPEAIQQLAEKQRKP